MTGMPAWGKTHTDEEIWAMTAFVETLPRLTPAQYQTMSRTIKPVSETPGQK